MKKGSKWLKVVSKEDILILKKDNNFEFYTKNLSVHFNIPERRMGEILKYYKIKIDKKTRTEVFSIEEWRECCIKKHNNYFDYSKSVYKNSKTLVTIGCPVHGDIKVNPVRHRQGYGCRKCSNTKQGEIKKTTLEDYKNDARKTHNYKYSYELLEDFKTLHEKGNIICPIHGVFRQKLYAHRYGSGCEMCSYEERGLDKRVTIEEFKKRAPIVHDNKYDYTNSFFSKIDEEIEIGCPHHGPFIQIGKNHMSGNGCPLCGKIYSAYSFKGDDNYIEISKKLQSGVYLLKFKDFYKIGITKKLRQRINLITSRIGLDYKPKILVFKKMSLFDAVNMESKLHNKYNSYRFTHSLYFEGQTECFNTNLPIQEIVNMLNFSQ